MSAPTQQPRSPSTTPASSRSSNEQALGQVLSATEQKMANLNRQLTNPDRVAVIEEVLPDGMKGQAKRLIKMAMITYAGKVNDLSSCPDNEFIRCVVAAAELGLAIDGKLGYVVRYKNTWQFQPDYKGLIAVAKRCGQITDCYADVVCQGDTFRAYRQDGESHLIHEPPAMFGRRGDVVGAYAIVKLPDGGWRYELMDLPDLERIRSRAPAKNGPWSTDVNEMRKKTVIRRLLKTYCDDPAFVKATLMDDEAESAEREALRLALEQTQQRGLPMERASLRNGNGHHEQPAALDDAGLVPPPAPEQSPEQQRQSAEDEIALREFTDDIRGRLEAADRASDLGPIKGTIDAADWIADGERKKMLADVEKRRKELGK